MFENILILPLLLPLATAALCAAVPSRFERQRGITLVSLLTQVLVGLGLFAHAVDSRAILVLNLGGWGPGLGIIWIADILSCVFLLLGAVLFLATAWSLPEGLDEQEKRHAFPLLNILMFGVNGAFLTGDLFNLFVFFEIMLLSSFVLISQGDLVSRIRSAFPYVVINLIASGFFLFALGILYASAGTVTIADLGRAVGASTHSASFWAACLLIIFVFCVKAGLVPWHFWLPDSYPRSSIPINALFAGLLTKVGIYALFRFVPVVQRLELPLLSETLLALAVTTMLFGVLGALGRAHFREILSFHIISQVGYMVFGLGLATRSALVAALFYVIHHMVVKSALFFAVGIPELAARSGKLGVAKGLLNRDAAASLAFLIPALALAGLPPLSGFWGKFYLISAGFSAEAWFATGTALLVSLFTLASMLKIWNASYWGDPDEVEWSTRSTRRLRASALALSLICVGIGLGSGPIFETLMTFADDLFTADAYVAAVEAARVVGEGRKGEL